MPKDNLSVEEILTKLENEVAADVSKRIIQHSSGRNPKSSHAEAKAALNQYYLKEFLELIGPDAKDDLDTSLKAKPNKYLAAENRLRRELRLKLNNKFNKEAEG